MSDEPFVLLGDGGSITSVEEWRERGAPAGRDLHWVDGRSAKELAKAWCASGAVAVPADLSALFASHPTLTGLELREGFAELKTDLRGEQRGPRNHDLLLVAEADVGRVVIGIEAKADESFDRTLAERWVTAQATVARGEATNWPARLERLARALLGVEAVSSAGDFNEEVADVPYQLVSALAGTLIEAEEREAVLAVLVVHVFATERTRPEVVEANKKVFARFVERVAHVPLDDVADGRLYGPFTVPGGGAIPSIPALIGIVTTR
jgi:hypothetical protein